MKPPIWIGELPGEKKKFRNDVQMGTRKPNINERALNSHIWSRAGQINNFDIKKMKDQALQIAE